MALSNNNFPRNGHPFLALGLALLIFGMVFGLVGALQYLSPGLWKEQLSFERVRPLHVSSVVFWILLAASGAVLHYLPEHTGRPLFSDRLRRLQFILFATAVLAILGSYFLGIFGGREYWEFHPLLAVPIVLAWVLFLFNVFRSLKTIKRQPVYVWMWMTGVSFFLFTFLESYLWLIPYFRANIVNDMTVQWKSYGSLVGSWNMLVYGCSIYLMDKITGDKRYGVSKIGFAVYFLGLFNLMFNWGHHIYTLPTAGYIKYVSYLVSMTELILFFRMIYLWKSSVTAARRHFYHIPYRFLLAADWWIFLTLAVAIGMSIPALNVYTHGTHITVGHTMGATIGINSFLLFAFVFDILWDTEKASARQVRWFDRAFWLANGSLFVFWCSLLLAGVFKAQWQMTEHSIPFSKMMAGLWPYFLVFFLSGLVLFLSFSMLILFVLRNRKRQGSQTPQTPKAELDARPRSLSTETEGNPYLS